MKKEQKFDIPYYEEKYGIKITFPFQYLTEEIAIKIKAEDPEFFKVGCADISYGSIWMHRDCLGHNCDKCLYYQEMKTHNKISKEYEPYKYVKFTIPIGNKSKSDGEKSLKKIMKNYKDVN